MSLLGLGLLLCSRRVPGPLQVQVVAHPSSALLHLTRSLPETPPCLLNCWPSFKIYFCLKRPKMQKKYLKRKVNLQIKITFLFIAFQKNELHTIDRLIDIYRFMMLDIVYGILDPRNKMRFKSVTTVRPNIKSSNFGVSYSRKSCLSSCIEGYMMVFTQKFLNVVQ